MGGFDPPRFGAGNPLRDTISDYKKGAVNGEVTLQWTGGKTVTAIITHASIDRLALKEGDPAVALTKSSRVILGVAL